MEAYFGAVRGSSDKMVDGVQINTDFHFQSMSLAGAEFQVWRRLTWSMAIGGAGTEGDLQKIHPQLGTVDFAALTTLRWYL